MSTDNDKSFIIQGKACTVFDDPERAIEIDNNELMIPWCGDPTIMIDRFDGRGYLTDLHEHECIVDLSHEDYMTEEEIAIEKICDFERYLELQMDVSEVAIENEENKKRSSENLRNKYGAVGFSYNEESDKAAGKEVNDNGDAANGEQEEDEEPYICPSELLYLCDVKLPTTNKQAQIIEKTAVFIAQKGTQMEIIVKTKQKDNPKFGFLNYDHELNPFYKEIVKLISQGRYMPKPRSIANTQAGKDSPDNIPNKSIEEDQYELKFPKMDISNTSYAALINKFKKVNENAALAAAIRSSATSANVPSPNSADINTPKSDEVDQLEDNKGTSLPSPSGNLESSQMEHKHNPVNAETENTVNESPNALVNPPVTETTQNLTPLSQEQYEKCYHEYYKHYYTHYYAHFASESSAGHADIVQQSAKAAAVAAAAAVNAVQQARLKQIATSVTSSSSELLITPEQRGIINKMAEYVMRNGLEFEELVVRQKSNDPRFGFLRPEHPLHSYYRARRREIDPDDKIAMSNDSAEYRNARILNSTDKASCVNVDDKSMQNYEKADSPNTLTTPSTLPNKNINERQSSISFRLTRPSSSSKLRSANTPEDSSSNPHDSIVDDSTSVMDPEITNNHDKDYDTDGNIEFQGPITISAEKPPHHFVLPGIPSASSSSSSSRASSPIRPTHSPSPDRSIKPATPSSESGSAQHDSLSSYDLLALLPLKQDYSPNHSNSDILSPLKSDHSSPCHSTFNNRNKEDAVLSGSWSTNVIEDLLELDDPTTVSSKSFGSQGSKSKELDHELMEERRRRAAQLVSRLRMTEVSSKTDSGRHNSSTSEVMKKQKPHKSRDRNLLSPPPAPDSVPAAVAHAVVASLKRRQEESLEAEAKARRRLRTPPAAYAFPRELNFDKSPNKSSSHNKDLLNYEDLLEKEYEKTKRKSKKHRKSKY